MSPQIHFKMISLVKTEVRRMVGDMNKVRNYLGGQNVSAVTPRNTHRT